MRSNKMATKAKDKARLVALDDNPHLYRYINLKGNPPSKQGMLKRVLEAAERMKVRI